MKEIMEEWNEFLNWCKEKNLNPSKGIVLNTYVYLKKRGEL